ncbi:hypothetical protein FGO68_gene11745 [Halteria grandinella]|uniref:Uncharacterized protein n=1 Tax=Halteria grandinella TaxID=5974 RepID=A0A8J8SX13_HALGN|nr:hypothetical protein FGO68_gene11745 [Halteria grandinella]
MLLPINIINLNKRISSICFKERAFHFVPMQKRKILQSPAFLIDIGFGITQVWIIIKIGIKNFPPRRILNICGGTFNQWRWSLQTIVQTNFTSSLLNLEEFFFNINQSNDILQNKQQNENVNGFLKKKKFDSTKFPNDINGVLITIPNTNTTLEECLRKFASKLQKI